MSSPSRQTEHNGQTPHSDKAITAVMPASTTPAEEEDVSYGTSARKRKSFHFPLRIDTALVSPYHSADSAPSRSRSAFVPSQKPRKLLLGSIDATQNLDESVRMRGKSGPSMLDDFKQNHIAEKQRQHAASLWASQEVETSLESLKRDDRSDSLNKRVQDAKTALDRCEGRIMALEAELKELRENAEDKAMKKIYGDGYEMEHMLLEMQARDVKAQLEISEADLETVGTENERMRSQIAQLGSENQNLRTQVHTLRGKNPSISSMSIRGESPASSASRLSALWSRDLPTKQTTLKDLIIKAELVRVQIALIIGRIPHAMTLIKEASFLSCKTSDGNLKNRCKDYEEKVVREARELRRSIYKDTRYERSQHSLEAETINDGRGEARTGLIPVKIPQKSPPSGWTKRLSFPFPFTASNNASPPLLLSTDTNGSCVTSPDRPNKPAEATLTSPWSQPRKRPALSLATRFDLMELAASPPPTTSPADGPETCRPAIPAPLDPSTSDVLVEAVDSSSRPLTSFLFPAAPLRNPAATSRTTLIKPPSPTDTLSASESLIASIIASSVPCIDNGADAGGEVEVKDEASHLTLSTSPFHNRNSSLTPQDERFINNWRLNIPPHHQGEGGIDANRPATSRKSAAPWQITFFPVSGEVKTGGILPGTGNLAGEEKTVGRRPRLGRRSSW